MIEDVPYEKAKVYLNDLSDEMTILAYIGFAKKYHSVSKDTRQFLMKNFKGTKAIVDRNGKRLSVGIQELNEGDRLCRIHRFPKGLKQLTEINDRLTQALRSHGMLRFEVVRPHKLSIESKKELLDLISIVKSQTHTS